MAERPVSQTTRGADEPVSQTTRRSGDPSAKQPEEAATRQPNNPWQNNPSPRQPAIRHPVSPTFRPFRHSDSPALASSVANGKKR